MIVYIAAGGAVVVLLFIGVFAVRRRRRRKLDPDYFLQRWKDLQRHCAQRKTWPQAVIEADELLDEALKRCRYKGKSTGERLVAAQHDLSDNEAVWFGHKLRKRVPDEDVRKLRKQDVLEALNGFRQAMRDIGALEVKINDQP
jgi:Mg-chelatase subunit ChlI